MNFSKLVLDFAATFGIVLVVTAGVTFLYGFVVHGSNFVDWETSFRMALILGIVLPAIHYREHRNKSN